MIAYVLEACRTLRAKRTLMVVGYQAERVRAALGEEAIEFVLQQEQRGTGHALLQTGQALSGFDGDLLVLSGDTPLLTSETLEGLLEAHRRARVEATILTAEVPEPSSYGRVVRDERGELLRIVEEPEATPREREIREINAGVYCFASAPLIEALQALRPSSVKGELYLPDVVALLRERGGRVQAYRTTAQATCVFERCQRGGVPCHYKSFVHGPLSQSRRTERSVRPAS
jgi:bifunctional UDP-N-acetylglucosamine pyrophosphorylase/glucosamine-1-phosphate N-acetyltransferase